MSTSAHRSEQTPPARPFGNDAILERLEACARAADAAVDTKTPARARIGNDAGFVRVRKRPTGWSFDVVRAVRMDGKPRQKFLFGLGTVKQPLRLHRMHWFWWRAMKNLHHNVPDEHRRRQIIEAMVRKGAPPLTPEILEWFIDGWPFLTNARAVLEEAVVSKNAAGDAFGNDAEACQ